MILKKVNIIMPILIDVDKEIECIIKEYIDGPILIDLIANNNIEVYIFWFLRKE
jgi:tRNA A-37 threonylcarbamoyl transferase component Bud32